MKALRVLMAMAIATVLLVASLVTDAQAQGRWGGNRGGQGMHMRMRDGSCVYGRAYRPMQPRRGQDGFYRYYGRQGRAGLGPRQGWALPQTGYGYDFQGQ